MREQEYRDSLQNSVLGNLFNSQELEMLFTHSKILDFSAGETILQQGKQADGIYIIVDGTVILTAKLLGEGTTHLETLGPGNFLGEVSFIEKVPCATSGIARNHVRCLLITNTYVELLSEYLPETKYKLFNAISKQVCERLKKMHDKITHFISHSDMATRPLFSEIIQSLTKPTEIHFEDQAIDIARLEKFPLFHFFTKDEIDELFKHTVLLKAPKNCTLIRKGEKNASCYIVLHGAVQSSIIYENKAAKLSVIGPSTLFAGIACVDCDSKFTITFATCELAVLFKISESDLEFFQIHKPILWYKIFDLICKSLIALEKSVDKLDIRLNIETYNR